MKKYYKLFLFLITLLFPGVVFAATEINYDTIDEAYDLHGEYSDKGIAYFEGQGFGCISLLDGEYIVIEEDGLELSTDFFCLADATITLDLNGKEIYSTNSRGAIMGDGVNLTITGDGALETGGINTYSMSLKDSNLTIESGAFYRLDLDTCSNVHIIDGLFDGVIVANDINEIIIDGGTFNNNVMVEHSNTLVVNGGEFYSSEESFTTHKTKNVVINDGEFNANIPVALSEAENIMINGGDYLGKKAGLIIYDENIITDVQIRGGHFKATGEGVSDSRWGSIAFASYVVFDKDYMQTWLDDDYEYSPALVSSLYETNPDEMIYVYGQPEISVVRSTPIIPDEEDDEEAEEPKEKEQKKDKEPLPPTGDNILLYIGTIVISIGATIFTGLKANKKEN